MTKPDPMMRLKRLRFRAARRGFKEADLILGGFADRRLEKMAQEELDAFEALLGETDHDIYAWAAGQAEPPARHAAAITALRADIAAQSAEAGRRSAC